MSAGIWLRPPHKHTSTRFVTSSGFDSSPLNIKLQDLSLKLTYLDSVSSSHRFLSPPHAGTTPSSLSTLTNRFPQPDGQRQSKVLSSSDSPTSVFERTRLRSREREKKADHTWASMLVTQALTQRRIILLPELQHSRRLVREDG